MERGSGESHGNFFDKMTQDIAEEIIPADSIKDALDASKFEHLKETAEERAKKNQKTLAEGKSIVNPTLNVLSVEKARTSAREAAEAISREIDETLNKERIEAQNHSLLAKAKGLFGKVGGFFKKNFGSASTPSREVQINFPPVVEKTGLIEVKSPGSYIDAFFNNHLALERHLKLDMAGQNKENTKATFESYKSYLTDELVKHIDNLVDSKSKGGIKNQADFDARVEQKLITLLKGRPSVQLKGADGKPRKDRDGKILVNEALFRTDVKVTRTPAKETKQTTPDKEAAA